MSNTNLDAFKEKLAEAAELGPKADVAHCRKCRQPFEMGVNVFTDAGRRETAISGVCEKCFDEMFGDEDE